MLKHSHAHTYAQQCDLALLTTDDPAFWKGSVPLELGGIPNLQDPVAVVGYPTGDYCMLVIAP
jgi:hypothetical protein